MSIEYKDFIGLYRGAFPKEYCPHLIKEFERLVESGAGSNRQHGEGAYKHSKNDMQLGLNFGVQNVEKLDNQSPIDTFFNVLQQAYDQYTDQFSILRNAKITGTAMKMQRTDPGGGYHVWHCEQGNGNHAERVLVYMLYLNTLGEDEGGETEFLYQRIRIRPEEGLMVLWPSAFTHAHRGNTVLGNTSKYIVTGWFYYE